MEGSEFLRRMGAADPSLWADLLPVLTKVALGACRDLQIFDAAKEDIVQDVALKVFKDWQSFRNESSLATWIYAITRNRCLEVLRRRRVRKEEQLEAAGAATGDEHDIHPAYEPSLEQTLCVQQVIAELEAQGKVRKDSMRMADVITWWVVNSPSTEELAAFLKTTVGAAKQRKSQILARVRELCVQFCGDENCSARTRE